VALAVPVRVPALASVQASARVRALVVRVQAPAVRRLQVKRRARSARPRVVVAEASSNTPRPKKAR